MLLYEEWMGKWLCILKKITRRGKGSPSSNKQGSRTGKRDLSSKDPWLGGQKLLPGTVLRVRKGLLSIRPQVVSGQGAPVTEDSPSQVETSRREPRQPPPHP